MTYQTGEASWAAPGVRLVTADPPTPTNEHVSYTCFGEEDLPRLEQYINCVRGVFSCYSSAFLQASRVHSVVLVNDLQVKGERRAAVPDDEPVLFLDPFVGAGNDAYQKHCIHHDFFHLVERQAFGRFGYDDPEWAKLNHPPMRYVWQTQPAGDVHALTHLQPGFINLYSTFKIEEDKAEIFGAMRVPEYRPILDEWAKSDPILQRKMNFLDEFVARVETYVPRKDDK